MPPRKPKAHSIRIAYYVTSHGYGHMNRSAAVINALPRSANLIVRTAPDQIDRFQSALTRPVQFEPGIFDCGAVHPPGESSLVDPAATLEKYRQIHERAAARLDREIAFLLDQHIDVVVSDIASLPLRAARLGNLPGILIANFTWYEIFKPYAANAAPEYRRMLQEMRREYEEATVVLRAEPAIQLKCRAPIREVGLIGHLGSARARELRETIHVSAQTPVIYVYVGRYGQHDMDWHQLEKADGCHFVSYHGLPTDLAHWHVLDPSEWPPADLAASVNGIVAKAGYGTVVDAMLHGRPIAFPPRFGFIEHRVLAAALRRWGGAVPLSTREFKTLELRRAIRQLLATKPALPPWPSDGAVRCAREILRIGQARGRP